MALDAPGKLATDWAGSLGLCRYHEQGELIRGDEQMIELEAGCVGQQGTHQRLQWR
jgi:hypothetical protein